MSTMPSRRPAPFAVAVAALVLVAATGCGALPVWSAPGPPVVVIGADLNLTGPGPGVAYDNGLALAVELVNAGRLAGEVRLGLRVLDNRGDAAASTRNLSQLASDGQVVAVVSAGCPRCVIEASGTLAVPVIALAGQQEVAAPADQRRWVFRLGPNAADNADALSLAMARAGVETVGVIAAADPYGQEGLRWITQAAGRDRMQVVATAQLDRSADAAAVTQAATKMAGWARPADPFAPAAPDPQQQEGETGPDAVVVWTYAPQADQLAAALRAAGYAGGLYLDMVAASELFLPDGSPLAGATLVFTTTPVADQRIASSPAAAARQEWVLDYVARYRTYHLHSTWAADAVLVVADAIARAEAADPAAVRDRLESVRLDGLTGPIRLTGDQHSGLSPHALVTLTGTAQRWQ